MNTLNEQIAALERQHADKVEQLHREHAVRELLPQDVPPHFVHTSSKLYGSVASVHYGNSFQGYYGSQQQKEEDRLRSLPEAIALLRRIGEIIPFYVVKNACVSRKPDAAISAKEREQAESIRGPYEVQIEHPHGDPAYLEAFVRLANGQQIDVQIRLQDSHRYGGWQRTGGNENYSESWQFRIVEASLGQAQFIRFAAGPDRGPRSGSRHVYVFSSLADLDAVVEKHAEQYPARAG